MQERPDVETKGSGSAPLAPLSRQHDFTCLQTSSYLTLDNILPNVQYSVNEELISLAARWKCSRRTMQCVPHLAESQIPIEPLEVSAGAQVVLEVIFSTHRTLMEQIAQEDYERCTTTIVLEACRGTPEQNPSVHTDERLSVPDLHS